MVYSALILLVVIISDKLAGQTKDGPFVIPQITLTADPGFGPYIAGSHLLNTFQISDLPPQTSKIMFRFIDSDSIQIGEAQIRTGIDLTSDSWQVLLEDFNMPLSPQFHLQLTYKEVSVADYYIPYIVLADTVSFHSSQGWGPFITNNYTFSDTSWNPVPLLKSTFTVSNLPPRAYKAKFYLKDVNSIAIDSMIVSAPAGQFLQNASWADVRMDNLPLNTQELCVVFYCNGAPDDGLEYRQTILITPHKPRLYSISEGTTLNDSIGIFIQNPMTGQALMVDSVKHAEITNGPGEPWLNGYRGPYSFDVIKGDFTIEAWLQLDLDKIINFNQQESEFIKVDSVFAITYVSQYGGASSAFRFYAIANGEYYRLYEGGFSNTLLSGSSWHHFAFCMEGTVNNLYQFYLNGNAISTFVDNNNMNYILQHIPYTYDLRTKPLIIGGNDHTQYSFITAFDEVRIFRYALAQTDIKHFMHRKVMQDQSLFGYWDFDDQRNRLNWIADKGFLNNSGQLKNHACFIPEFEDLFTIRDTIIVETSMKNADSIRFFIIDQDNRVLDSIQLKLINSKAQWVTDISAQPYTASHFRITELIPAASTEGFETDYSLYILPPAPIATPQCNWGIYYTATGGI